MDTQKTHITHDTIFVFDLHGVVFTLNIMGILSTFMQSSNKKCILSTLVYPQIFFKLLTLWRSGGVIEQCILSLPNDYPHLTPCINDIIHMMNAQKPITNTVQVIQHLKSQGKKVFILSNNGEQSIKILQQQFPDIFDLFDGVQYAMTENNYIGKPNPTAFHAFCKKFNCSFEQLVLIDDSVQNLITARALGMKSIHYTNSSSLTQLLHL